MTDPLQSDNGTARTATAVVQGASGGIGSALVCALLDRDPLRRVIALGRKPERLHEALGHRARRDPRLQLEALDIGDDDSIEQGAGRLLAKMPRIDVLLHASGTLSDPMTRPEKRLEQLNRRSLLHSFEVNALGPLLVTRALLPGLLAAHRPRVAVLSARVGSIGDNGLGGWYGYRASKAALNMLVRTLSIELARRAPGSLCVALHPGTVATALSDPFGARLDRLTPSQSASRLLDVLEGLGSKENGSFWGFDGQRILW